MVKQFARDVVYRASAVAGARALARFNSTDTENNRLNGFYNADRHIAGTVANPRRATVSGGVARKDTDIPFSAVKNYFLFQDGESFEGLASSDAKTRLQLNKNIVTNAYLIKTAVKRDFGYSYVCKEYIGRTSSDVR